MIKGIIENVKMHFGSEKSKIDISRKWGVTIGTGCSLLGTPDWGSEPYLICIGNNVKITERVKFVTHDGGVHVLRRKWCDNIEEIPQADIFGKIIVGDNVFIGINTIILPGVTIGNNVIIGAGSIITHDVPSDSVACGVPARVIATLEEYYYKNKDRILLTKGQSYEDKKRAVLDYFNKK